jgi:hypothetical protein
VKGIYKHGSIELTEIPENIEESQVIVTFLEAKLKKSPKHMSFGMFAGSQQSNKEDFKMAEFTDDSDDGLD